MTAGERHERPGVAAAAGALGELVPYLRVSVGRAGVDPGGWLDCGRLVAEPERLRAVLMECGVGRGTDDPQVAASLFVQAWAFRVAAAALGCWWCGGVVPDLDPARCAIALGRHRPNAVDLTEPAAARGGVDDASTLAAVVVGHMAAVVAAVRATTTVGERLLWGNTAASVAAAARTLDGVIDPDDRPRLRAVATALLGADAPPPLRDLGRFTTDDATGAWRWARTNCCLNHRLPDRRLCDDCPLDAPPPEPAAGADRSPDTQDGP